PGHPVGQPVRRLHRRPRLPAAVPELALAGRPDHRGQRPHVRGRAAVPGRLPRPGARREPALPAARRQRARAARVRRRRPADLLVGLRGGVEARHRPGHRVRGHRRRDGVRPAASADSVEVRALAPVWLIGLGIISWLGQYSGSSDKHPLPPTSTGTIPFWWDIVVVAAFSLAIYYWAMYSKLPRAEMLELVERQSGEQELPDP